MHPTLLATEFPTGEVETGSIVGTVAAASGVDLGACGDSDERPVELSDFVPTATPQGGGTTEEGDVDASTGMYSIEDLAPGTYDLGFITDVVVDVGGTDWTITFEADFPTDVLVEANNDVQADYEITSVSCSN
jgi:hypothetical protein